MEQNVPPAVGDAALVQTGSGVQAQAQILRVRQNRAKETEYFVHYLDKRLDAWIARHHIIHVVRHESSNAALQEQESAETDRVTRLKKRKLVLASDRNDSDVCKPASALDAEPGAAAEIKYTSSIRLGAHRIATWYYSPYPEPFDKAPELFICEHCLKYFKSAAVYERHQIKCRIKQPGTEIYRHGKLAVYQVDGAVSKLYCQNLCLAAKLFLDRKSVFYDIHGFLFYVLIEHGHSCRTLLGFFSQEKHSIEDYNVACILTFPPHQRKGYGQFLIALSYELSRRMGKIQTPERPLSDLGLLSYQRFWQSRLLHILNQRMSCKGATTVFTLESIAAETGIAVSDLAQAADALGVARFWRGNRIVGAMTRALLQKVTAEQEKDAARVAFQPHCLISKS